ncbi:MAG: hypothetical protein HY210_07015 [Candidatus Omnitrophica bacterium]|nr:hypothetical protein [Candidatus Omnitrophota bacterium]
MNKKITATAILILALAAFAPNSFAAFAEYKMVGSFSGPNKYLEKSVFGFNETPYLYMKLPDGGKVFTGSFWRAPDASIFYISTKNFGPASDRISDSGSGLVLGKKRWITLEDWDSVKKVGTWEVSSNYFYKNGDTGYAKTSFMTTPEPLAMTLFLLGGAPIAVNLYRKKRLLKA